jgi:hypothetical protein
MVENHQETSEKRPAPPFNEQKQTEPGLAKLMEPKPDHGEDSYIGHGLLEGRKALITGADSGIGRAVAIAFAREGADVVLSYLPEEQPDADEVIELIERTGRRAIPMPGDISDEGFCDMLITEAVEQMGRIDILVNVAGRQVHNEDITTLSTEQFEQTFRTNVYAMFWLCKYALPYMTPGSAIINTASIQAYQPSEFLLDYAPTKAAIVAFTKAFAKQVADKDVRVNAVAPGPIWTPLQPSEGQPMEKLKNFGKNTPLKRPGQPAEVAPAYVFLASEASTYITAEVIGVTGGHHLP